MISSEKILKGLVQIMNKDYAVKIDKIINKDFDSRLSIALINYIMDVGFAHLKEKTEKEIDEEKSDCSFISDNVCKAMVRTAVRICKECTKEEVLTYIRCNLAFTPQIKPITLFKEFFTSYDWESLMDSLEIDDEEQEYEESVSFLAILD
jgi:hypothetical protein